MAATSGTTTLTKSCNSSQTIPPPQDLAGFLVKECPRYVPLPYLFRCDAIVVHQWFADNLFAPDCPPQRQCTERLFELMQPDYSGATVLCMKLLQVHRNRDHPDRFRLRWSREDVESSELFLISFFGLPDHAAVIPTSYIRYRYGDTSNIDGIFELGQAYPSLLAPFMVHYRDLVKFLENIYEHASTSATSDPINPTNSVVYPTFEPKLEHLHEIMPQDGQLDKLLRMHELYLACRSAKHDMKLSRRGEPGHFTLAGHAVEYFRRSFHRAGRYGEYLQIRMTYQISGKKGLGLPAPRRPSWEGIDVVTSKPRTSPLRRSRKTRQTRQHQVASSRSSSQAVGVIHVPGPEPITYRDGDYDDHEESRAAVGGRG